MKGRRVEVQTKDRQPGGEDRPHRYYSPRKVDRSPSPHTRSGSNKRPHQSRRDEEPQSKCQRDQESAYKNKSTKSTEVKSSKSKKKNPKEPEGKSRESTDDLKSTEVKSNKSSQSKKRDRKEREKSEEPELMESTEPEVSIVEAGQPESEPGLTSEGPSSTGKEYRVNEGASTSGIQSMMAVPSVASTGPPPSTSDWRIEMAAGAAALRQQAAQFSMQAQMAVSQAERMERVIVQSYAEEVAREMERQRKTKE